MKQTANTVMIQDTLEVHSNLIAHRVQIAKFGGASLKAPIRPNHLAQAAADKSLKGEKEMNKLNEIKKAFANDSPWWFMIEKADIAYLFHLLEEKDKALESSKEAIEHMLREQPNEMWTIKDVESWESIGTDTVKEIDKALNTSSNNKGEI